MCYVIRMQTSLMCTQTFMFVISADGSLFDASKVNVKAVSSVL